MHIKKIVIQGFKTYKNTTIIDLLSPHHNVVVGRNGSGKSNFFAAIRFVLSDAYTHMTREERQGLIHEGSGTVMSAYVEIVFDNTDGRFPINREEISIRRTIGLKKDDYSLDGKSATRSDIMNLLESAGFSRSNPYYIVPQGRITALTNSKDSERLQLLKEVSGAIVFETKLKESMKEMTNANYKEKRIDEALKSIDDRLADLQIETSDLKKFQSLEKSKKIFEYNLFDREVNELSESIESIDEKYSELLNGSQRDLEDLDKREKLCQQLTETINDLKISLKLSILEKEQSDLDYNRLLSLISEKEVRLNELKSTIATSKEQHESLQFSIRSLESSIKSHEFEISKLKPDYNELKNKEFNIKNSLADLILQQRLLYSKQNRFSKFNNKAQRDKWLKNEIIRIKSEMSFQEEEILKLSTEASGKEIILNDLNQKITKLNEAIQSDNTIQLVYTLQNAITDSKAKGNELIDQRKHLWRDEIRLKSIYDSIQNDLNNANYSVNQTMDRSQAQGLNSVRSIITKLNLQDRVYGPISELFTVSDKYKTAVEVIAGNSLFHVVVDNDKTASLIMDELIRTKSGRVTFIPLNRIDPSRVEYPDGSEYKCIPMIKKLKYDERVSKAIKHIFGKTIICSNLQHGSELAKSFKLTAITLDGDRADNRGVLSGGFRDYKKSRIDALKLQLRKKKELTKAQEDLEKCVDNIESINQQLTANNNEVQMKIRELDRQIASQEPRNTELAKLNNQKYNINQELDSLKVNLNSIKVLTESNNAKIKEHQTELGSKFTHSLTDEETHKLEELNAKLKIHERDLDEVVMNLSDIETKISQYESELTNNYKPRLSKLTAEQISPSQKLNQEEAGQLETELTTLTSQLDILKSKIKVASEEFVTISNEIGKCEESLKKANDQQASIIKRLDEFSKTTEKILNKKSILTLRRDEISKKIRELGVLPEEAFQQTAYDNINSDGLLKKLNTINDELSQFAHINKKALEQYNTFTRQRNDLVQRKTDLEKSRVSIDNLIKNLETQKDDAITKSFKQVAKSFHEIFEKLVPLGLGNLIMQKRSSASIGESHSDEETNSQNQQTNVENYVGVSISVSFNSKNDEQQRIEQLSGGQKSLCAIALILAIQKCDPAPFYLFDEIDANLDTQYRTSVAAMINSLSENAQFICTTFRPEMLQVANKFYGVMFGNKVSTVSEINKEDALTFVDGQQQH